MPVPSKISDLSKVASENSPAGTETVKGTIDDYLRAGFGFLRQLADLVGGPTVPLASAATVAIGFAASANINITGTTTITAFDNADEGVLRWVTFAGALTLTHNAGTLQLPGAANIITRAGDVAVFKSLGAGNWKCMGYQRTSGTGPVAASMLTDGYLSTGDWNSFNSRMTPAAVAAAYLARNGSNTMDGRLQINAPGEGLTLNSSTPVAIICLRGTGGEKFIQVSGNGLEVISSGYGASILSLDNAGNLVAKTGNFNSDERLKKKWRRRPADFLERIANIRRLGDFLWKKDGTPGIGGSAQELEAIWPEAVHTDARGFKSVNYGAAAFVIAVELTRAFFAYVAKTDKRLARLEGK